MGSRDVRIRSARSEDAAAFASIYAPIVTGTMITFEEIAPSTDEMRHRIGTIMERLPWLAAESDERVVGYAYASPHSDRAGYRWSVNVSVYIDPGSHRRGIGRRLYAALLDILERQRFRRAYAGIALPNDASVGLHRAMGFEEVGLYRRVGWKLGSWYDVMWLGRNIGIDTEDRTTPAEPVPFATLAGDLRMLDAAR